MRRTNRGRVGVNVKFGGSNGGCRRAFRHGARMGVERERWSENRSVPNEVWIGGAKAITSYGVLDGLIVG